MNYRIVGQDGKTYGPVAAETIREWLAQGRVESRTPVFVAGAADWTFIGLLPEFSPQANPATLGSLRPDLTLAKKTTGFATAGFVCGLLSWCCCCCGFPLSVLGIIFSIIAMVQIKSSPVPQSGWGLALAGLICSIAGMVFGFLLGLVQVLTENVSNPGANFGHFNWH
jgi:hypothetical protein